MTQAPQSRATRIFYASALIIAGILMTFGIGAFLSPQLGEIAGHTVGLLAAVVIEGVFTQSILQWRNRRSFEMLLLATAFGSLSVVLDSPVIFSVVRGSGITGQSFAANRDMVVRDITIALGQIQAAKRGADDLAAYSNDQEATERKDGGTCNLIGGHEGERYRFRKHDVETFSIQAKALDPFIEQLTAALNNAETLASPTNGPALVDALRALNDDMAKAAAAAHDKGLADVGQQFADRSSSDGSEQQDAITKVRFVCPDPTIKARTKAIAAQLQSMPALERHIDVADMRDIATAMVELPRRLFLTLRQGLASKDGLSGDDIGALFLSSMIEVMLLGVTLVTHPRAPKGPSLAGTSSRAAELRRLDLTSVLATARQLPDDIAFLRRQVEIYRKRVFPFDLLVVAHDCDEPGLRRLAEVMPDFCVLGCAARHPWLPMFMIRRWIKRKSRRDNCRRFLHRWRLPAPRRPWPAEMRDAARFELFRINLRMLDELQLAARLQAPDAEPASPPNQGNIVTLPPPARPGGEPPDIAAE